MRRIAILVFLFITTYTFAQNKVTGVVYLKSNDNPLAGVVVQDSILHIEVDSIQVERERL